MQEILGEKMYTREETAKMLHVSETTFYRIVARGAIRQQRIGNRVWFSETSIRDFLNGKPSPSKKNRHAEQ